MQYPAQMVLVSPKLNVVKTVSVTDHMDFGTSGFGNAETKYAGSEGTHSLEHANSDKAVSQYDVACLQLTGN